MNISIKKSTDVGKDVMLQHEAILMAVTRAVSEDNPIHSWIKT